MNWFTLLLFHAITVVFCKINYQWIEHDDRWDSVVGIVVNRKPVSTGVFILPEIVVTSASPVERLRGFDKNVSIYVIDGKFNVAKRYRAHCIIPPYFNPKTAEERFEAKWWVQMGPGFEKFNSPIHDIYVLALEERFLIPSAVAHYWFNRTTGRAPMIPKVATSTYSLTPDSFMFAGFGYLDQEHVRDNTQLEVENYGNNHVLENCDEWVSRDWGRFICLKNINNNAALPAGAPLFNKGMLVGIGSFSMTRNDETIHVFTDIRPYLEHFRYCLYIKNFDPSLKFEDGYKFFQFTPKTPWFTGYYSRR